MMADSPTVPQEEVTPAEAASILGLPDADDETEGATASVTLKVRATDLELAELVARKRKSFWKGKPAVSPLLRTAWEEIVAEGAQMVEEAKLKSNSKSGS